MEHEACHGLLDYLRSRPLDPDLAGALDAEAPRWLAWLAENGAAAVTPGAVLRGLRYLGRATGSWAPGEAEVLSDWRLIWGAPRYRAWCLLVYYLLLRADRFDLSLLPRLESQDGHLSPIVAANRSAVLAGAADIPDRTRRRGLPGVRVQAARERLAGLAFQDRGGVSCGDLPDLAYDLRLVSFDHRGYSFSLQAFYGRVTAYRLGPGQEIALTDGSAPRPGAEPVLQPGDDAIELHIDRGADLSGPALEAAVAAAVTHYRKHFPEHQPKALFTISWLMDPQLRSLLPANSRICRFQSLFRLFAARYDRAYARECVFGGQEANGCLTSLQRAVLELEAKGGHLREGGGLRLLP